LRGGHLFAAVLATGLLAAAPALAQETRVKTGTLRCDVSPGVAVIVGSRELACQFRPMRGRREAYGGRLTKVGANLYRDKSGNKYLVRDDSSILKIPASEK